MTEIRERAWWSGLFWSIVVFVAIAVVWQGSIWLFQIPAFLLPPLEDVFGNVIKLPGFYALHTAYTLGAALLGFMIAVALGILLALIIVSSAAVERSFLTLLTVINSVPKIAVAPLFVLWLGVGVAPKIAMAVLTAIFVIVVDVVVGMRSVDPEIIDMARINQASPLAIFWRIKLPNSLPHLFGALRVAASLAVVGAIVAEFIGGQRGLGYVILLAQGRLDAAQAFAGIFILSIMATALCYAVVWTERFVIPWHASHRAMQAKT
jgi:NitT/TauT family transport system permease protein